MLWYDPAYGFWIFLVCCLFLVWLSFATETKKLNALVRKLNDAAVLKWRSLTEVDKAERHKSDSPKSGSL